MGQMNSVAVNLIHLGIVFPYLDTRVAQRDRVIAGLMEAIEVSTGLGRVTLQVASRQALMQIHLDADEIEEGLAIAAGLPERWADVAPIQQATVACTLAGLAQLGGESVRAESAFRQAVRAFSESGHTGYVWRAECFLALLLYELDRPDEADRLLVQAMTGDGSDVRVWLEDIRVLSGSLYRQRGAEGSGAAGDDEERLARIREGRGLESLQTPIQTTRAWVERMLARATARVER